MKLEHLHRRFRDLVETIEDKIKIIETVYQGLLLYFLSKGWKTSQSIFLLCKNGFDEDARILLRSLLELTVNLQYISKDESSRTLLFCEFAYLEKRNFEKVLRGYVKDNPDDPWMTKILASKTGKQLEDELKEFERVKTNYPDKRFWSGESLLPMAKKVGMHFHYILYTMFCRVSHPSSEGVNNYLKIQDGRLTRADCSSEDIDRAWWATSIYFLLILKEVNRSFSLELDAELTAIDTQLKEDVPTKKSSIDQTDEKSD